MIAFLDTEFTDLLHPELLSIGLVTLDGAEFYTVLDLDTVLGQARVRASSDFVRFGGVIELWRRVPGATCRLSEIGTRVGRWLLDQAARSPEHHIAVAFDYSTDYELMEGAIRSVDLWGQVRDVVSPRNVSALTGSRAGGIAMEAYYQSARGDGLGRHHALADARALRAAYAVLTGQKL